MVNSSPGINTAVLFCIGVLAYNDFSIFSVFTLKCKCENESIYVLRSSIWILCLIYTKHQSGICGIEVDFQIAK